MRFKSQLLKLLSERAMFHDEENNTLYTSNEHIDKFKEVTGCGFISFSRNMVAWGWKMTTTGVLITWKNSKWNGSLDFDGIVRSTETRKKKSRRQRQIQGKDRIQEQLQKEIADLKREFANELKRDMEEIESLKEQQKQLIDAVNIIKDETIVINYVVSCANDIKQINDAEEAEQFINW